MRMFQFLLKHFGFWELYLYKEIKMQHLEIVCNEK